MIWSFYLDSGAISNLFTNKEKQIYIPPLHTTTQNFEIICQLAQPHQSDPQRQSSHYSTTAQRIWHTERKFINIHSIAISAINHYYITAKRKCYQSLLHYSKEDTPFPCRTVRWKNSENIERVPNWKGKDEGSCACEG